MNECSAYVGLDVHKDTIAVALPGREEAVNRGEIKNQRKSLLRLTRSLSPHGEVVSYCYEAGPCGYGALAKTAGNSYSPRPTATAPVVDSTWNNCWDTSEGTYYHDRVV